MTDGVHVTIPKFIDGDSQVKTLRKLTAGRTTLLTPLAHRDDAVVSVVGPDGSVTELPDVAAVTEVL